MTASTDDIGALAKGGRTNIAGFALRLLARLPFLFIAGRIYGADLVGRFALAVVVVELAALVATLGLKRGLAQALSTTDRPHVDVVWDALAVALGASLAASAVLFAFPEIMYQDNTASWIERLLPLIAVAIAWSDISLAALAYRRDVKATVTARAVVEPWTLSVAAFAFSFVSHHDGLILAYMLSMAAALAASLIPLVRSYGRPVGWRPQPARLLTLARANMPLAGADSLEWGSRNVDRFILGLIFEPRIVGIYYMAQQVASLPQKLKTSFDPVLGPVIAANLARNDRAAVANQVAQVSFWIVAAQTCLALAGSIPSESVMGVVGPSFVAGATALAFLLFGEVAASTGAVCESALVYVDRVGNLMISVAMLAVQIALSFVLLFAARGLDWSLGWQVAAPAVALFVTLGLTSIIKARRLQRLLEAPVWRLRRPFVAATLAGAAVGAAFTALPRSAEWAELIIGVPAMAATYLFILWRYAFREEDRTLLRRMPSNPEPTLPL
ncbi:MAG: lipopolysaccharide biosynthesis protein [Pseudomonadota bacterium]